MESPEFLGGAIFIVLLDALVTVSLSHIGWAAYLRSTGPFAVGILVLAAVLAMLPSEVARYGWIVFIVIAVLRAATASRRRDTG